MIGAALGQDLWNLRLKAFIALASWDAGNHYRHLAGQLGCAGVSGSLSCWFWVSSGTQVVLGTEPLHSPCGQAGSHEPLIGTVLCATAQWKHALLNMHSTGTYRCSLLILPGGWPADRRERLSSPVDRLRRFGGGTDALCPLVTKTAFPSGAIMTILQLP